MAGRENAGYEAETSQLKAWNEEILQINRIASGLLILNSFMVFEGSIISIIRVAIVTVVMMVRTHPGGESFILGGN